MRRIFVEPEAIQGQRLEITGELVHHLGTVLRLSAGEKIAVCCGDGKIYQAELQDFGRDKISGEIFAETAAEQETKTAVHLFQGMPKGDKLELIIQKCTELGITKIIPLNTQRAVVKIEANKAQKKQERWQKIALEASQQSKRITVPEVSLPLTWKEAVREMQEGLTIVLWEDEDKTTLRQVLEELENVPQQINLVIGPEGGLTAEEVAELQAQGAYCASLGKRILRTETAGLAALTMVLYHYQELG